MTGPRRAEKEDCLRAVRDSSWAPSIFVAGLFVAVGCTVARTQEIWMDETTQLSGLHLGPIEVVEWLAGRDRDRFGVPGDRTPPLSYWIQWVWSQVFGLTEESLRVLGILVVALAAVIVVKTAARTWGGWAGWIAGLTLALSPNAIYAGAEIRAYPFFVLFSASAFWFLLRLNEDVPGERHRVWAGLVLSCLAAVYTHYFGLVLVGAMLVTASWMAVGRQSMRRPLILGAVAIAVGASGLVPFILSARGMSAGAGVASSDFKRSAIRLIYHCFGGHAGWAAYPIVLAAGLSGEILVLGVALLRRERSARTARLLALAVVAGLSASILARLATSSFDALQASYNLWTLPAVVVLGASAVAAEKRGWRIAGWTGSVLVLSANLVATGLLILHGEAFAHSAGDRINKEVAALGRPADLVIIHSGPLWKFGFCPLRYEFGAELPQYVAEWNPDGTLQLARLPDRDVIEDPSAIHEKRIALIRVENMGADGIARYLHTHEVPDLSDDRIRNAFVGLGWAPARSEKLMALAAEQVDWMESPSSPTPQ